MRRRTYIVLALAFAVSAAWGAARVVDAQRSSASATTTTCPSNPLTGVHDPERLEVLNACATFAGTVRKPASRAPDRDLTFDVAPDPAYASMLNAINRRRGAIHVEIIPIDQVGCSGSACSGADVAAPPVGAHIRLTGAWVLDRWTGWNEIHPTWKIEFLSGGTPPPPPPPPPSNAVHLEASLTGKGLGKHGARHGRGRVTLTLNSVDRVCWTFGRLTRIGRPTRAAIRVKPPGKRGHTALALARRYQTRGCVAVAPDLFESLAEEARDYYVLVASNRHPFGAIRGRLIPTA